MVKIIKTELRQRRHRRLRAKLQGDAKRPRLVVFRSLKHISAQIIDDSTGRTLLAVSDKGSKGKKVDRASELGKELANLALKKSIKTVVFDRAGYKYHGRVKALAEAARAAGLKF